jgi:hypothetical protein
MLASVMLAVEPGIDRPYHDCTCDGGRGCGAENHPATAGDEAAQAVEIAVLSVLRNIALCGDRQTEVQNITDQQHPSPGIDVNAEFETAHPAREQDLRQKDDACAADPDSKSGACHALGRGVLAGEPSLDSRRQAQQRAPHGLLLGFGQGHGAVSRQGLVATG